MHRVPLVRRGLGAGRLTSIAAASNTRLTPRLALTETEVKQWRCRACCKLSSSSDDPPGSLFKPWLGSGHLLKSLGPGIPKALQQIRGSGEKMFGCLFYPATLRKYRMLPQRRWRACKGMSAPVRETRSLSRLLSAIPSRECVIYDKTPVVRTGAY